MCLRTSSVPEYKHMHVYHTGSLPCEFMPALDTEAHEDTAESLELGNAAKAYNYSIDVH